MLSTLQAHSIDLGLVSGNPDHDETCRAICRLFDYDYKLWPDIDCLQNESWDCRVLIMVATEGAGPAECAQLGRALSPKGYLIIVVPKPLRPNEIEFVRKCGANLILLENELKETSKLHFACLEIIQASYLPIKPTDLAPGAMLTFDVFHLLPLNRKFIRFLFAGDVLETDRIQKLTEHSEYYIRRSDVYRFNEYSVSHNDNSASGLGRRCRSQFLLLSTSFVELALNLTDQSGYSTFQWGEELYNRLHKLCDDLLICLGSASDGYQIINHSAVGTFGSLERSAAIASYAALFGLELGIESLGEVMMAGLVGDLGILLLPPALTQQIREEGVATLQGDFRQLYRKYPNRSLNILLNRKLQIQNRVRQIMMMKQERADGTGFPRGINAVRLPLEPQLLLLGAIYDDLTKITMGKPRMELKAAREKILQAEIRSPTAFTSEFAQLLGTL